MLQFLLCVVLTTSLFAPNFVCDADKSNHEYMTAWCASAEAGRLKKEHALVSHDAVFNSFLYAFVLHEEVETLLRNRPHFDYVGKTIKEPLPEAIAGEEDAHKEERVLCKKAREEQEAVYNAWLESFQVVLAKFSARIIKNPHHVCPSALVIRFDAFPQYVVKMRARNGYRLGFYDAHGCLSCAVPGTKISELEFPTQLVARVLYAEEIKAFLKAYGIRNIQIPNKYLFVFPGHEDKPLDDENLFVVADFVSFKPEYQEPFINLLRAAYATYKLSEKKDSSDPLHKLLTNLFRVADGCALWDFSAGSGNFVFTFNDAGDPTVVFLDTERPAFGGSNPLYFFHKNDQECESNAGVGRNMLVELFTANADDFENAKSESDASKSGSAEVKPA